MTKTELLELLLVERFLPLPPTPKPATAPSETYVPVVLEDTKEAQKARCQALLEAEDDTAVLVKRNGLWIVKGDAA